MVGLNGCIAIYINRAAKLTQSPNIEYSLLDPLVPITPQNATPVDIPIAHLHLIFLNSCSIKKDDCIALTESF